MLKRRVEEVYTARDGLEGLEIYNKEKPQIIVSDIKMPRMNGLDMIEKLKEVEPELPVIVTSAHSESDYFLQAIDIGIDKFVIKPVNNRELFGLINKIYKQISLHERMKEEERLREIAQRNLRESQEQLRALFDNVVVGMGIVDRDMQIIFSNMRLAEMLLENEESLLTHRITEYLDTDSYTAKKLKKLINSQTAVNIGNFRSEEEILLGEEKHFWAEISISIVLSADGNISKFIIVVNDVNERVETQQERNALYNSLISELETAASVQSYFLPEWLYVEERLLFSNNYTPSTNVSGDLFDIVKLKDGRYLLYIGDISGHGVQSALIMTAVKTTIKMLVDNAEGSIHPSTIINQLNVLLCKDVFQNNYLTLLLGVIDVEQNKFIYYNAGHPPIISYNNLSGEVNLLEAKGSIPIGWVADNEYILEEEDELPLNESNSYLLYTDGLFECENHQHEELGLEGVEEILKKLLDNNNSEIFPYMIKKSILESGYNISSDDFTILTLKLRNPGEDQIRYYLVNPIKDSTGDIGKRCEEFLRARGIDELAFSTELLVNEYLNKISEHFNEKNQNSIIVIRLKLYEKKLEIVFWDKGESWELPHSEEELGFVEEEYNLQSSLYIIRNLADKINRQRIVDLNETVFTLLYNSKESS